jgi:YaiO family outer membrane protein
MFYKLPILIFRVFIIILFVCALFLFSGVSLLPPLAYAQQSLSKEKNIDVDELFIKARTIASQGNRKEAREICRVILKKKPGYHDVRVFFGHLYALDKEYDSARRELQQVIKEKPDHIDARNALIDVDYWSGNFRQALIFCNEGLKTYPDNEDFLLRKARILLKLEDYKVASVIIRQLLKIKPSNKEALQLLERIQYSSQQHKVSLSYRYDTFGRGESSYGPWHLFSFELSRKFKRGSIIGRVNQARRNFGSEVMSGSQFEIDAYPKITKRMYAYLNAGYSSSFVFPKYRLGGEIYTGLPASFELSLGVRYLNFVSSSVLIYTGNLGKYYKNYWFSFRPFITSKPSGLSFSGIFLIRRYFSDADNYLTLLAGFGSSPMEIFYIEDIERLNSYKIELELQKMITRAFLIRFGIRFEREEFRINQFGNRLTLSLALQQLIFKKY